MPRDKSRALSGAHTHPDPVQRAGGVTATIRRMLPMIWRVSPRGLLLVVALNLLQAAIPAVQVRVTAALIDSLPGAFAGEPSGLGAVYGLLGVQVSLLVAAAGLRALGQLTHADVELRTSFALEEIVSTKSARLPVLAYEQPEYYDKLHAAGLVQRSFSFIDPLLNLGQHILTALSYVIILAQFHLSLAACILLLMVPALMANLRVGKWRFAHVHKHTPTARRADYLSSLLKEREAAKEVRMFGLRGYLGGLWGQTYWQMASERLQLERRSAGIRLAADTFRVLTGFLAVGFLVWLGVNRRLSLGQYVAVSQAFFMAQTLVESMAFGVSRIYEDTLFASRFLDFLALPEESTPAHARPFPSPLREGIRLEGITFSYPGNPRPVLQSISCTIHPGEKVALIGENGSGKTTLVKCILGLYQPQEGVISYDGIPLHEIEPVSLRQNLTVIFQDFMRYRLSAKENIAVGDIDQVGDQEAVRKAARKAGADEFIAALPDGYETQLSPVFSRGVEPSGGQWQKIGLSRALMRKAELVILDEPTASIDPVSEAGIFDLVARLMQGKTSVLISHRLGVCRSVDRILVLKDGRIVEEGRHEELLNLGGEYARMYQLQARWYE